MKEGKIQKVRWGDISKMRCRDVTNLLVTAVIILNHNSGLGFLVLIRIQIRVSGSGGGGTRTCTHRNLLASFVGPVGLLYDLGSLEQFALLLVR